MSGSAVPVGMRLVADAGLTVLDDGGTLLGGAPLRLMRLRPGGARAVARWRAGEPVPDRASARRLARRLLDAGLMHPVPTGGPDATEVTTVIPVHDTPERLQRCLAGLAGLTGLTASEDSEGQEGAGSSIGAAGQTGSAGAAGQTGSAGAKGLTGSAGSAGLAGTAGAGGLAGLGGGPVVVVDDGSPDEGGIARVAAAAGARVIRHDAARGPAAARNAGLAAATTPYVAFIDADCVPGPEWLTPLLRHFADPAVAAVAPRITAHGRGTGWLARYEQDRSALDMGPAPSVVRPGARVPYVPSAALVLRRDAAGDGFDADMRVGEDVDLVWRLAAAGWTIRYEPAARVAHDHRVRLREWFTRRMDYGTSAAPLSLRHPGTLPAVSMSGWSAAAWGLAAAGRPVLGAALTVAVTARLARRLDTLTGSPAPLAAKLAGQGTLQAGRLLGVALARTWWPVALPAALAVRGLRPVVAAGLLIPPLLDWYERRPGLDPVRYTAAQLLDGAAYATGVWRGCLRERTAAPLLPRLWWRSPAESPGGPAPEPAPSPPKDPDADPPTARPNTP